MIYNEDTYYIGYHKNVRELGALPAVAFDTIAGLLRENDSDGVIANNTLADLLGITEQGLRKIISKLIECGYIEKIGGNGRGHRQDTSRWTKQIAAVQDGRQQHCGEYAGGDISAAADR